MMATEDSGEETDPASVVTQIDGGGILDTARFAFCTKPRIRMPETGPTLTMDTNRTLGSPEVSHQMTLDWSGMETRTGPASHILKDGNRVTESPSEGIGGRILPNTASPDGSAALPSVPPPRTCGLLGTVDEGDGLDGQEYEEEEVVFSLTAPPLNQYVHHQV